MTHITYDATLHGYQTYDYVGKVVQEYDDSPHGPHDHDAIVTIDTQSPMVPMRSTPSPPSFPDPTLAPTLEPTLEPAVEPLPAAVVIMVFIFIILWLFAGIAAFIMSIMCFGYSGTAAQHVIGFLLALFFGPLYWIYYFFVKSYCSAKIATKGSRRRR
jgi:hypothetical protein